MEELRELEVNEEEYEIVMFYRQLSKERKETFSEFLETLEHLLNDEKSSV